MLRNVVGVVVGFVGWSVLWLVGGMAARTAAPGAFDESGMTADPGVLGAILGLSVVCSVLGGVLCSMIARRRVGALVALAVLLLAVGIAVQASAWEQMPLWYHVPFLALLVPATVVGGLIPRPREAGSV